MLTTQAEPFFACIDELKKHWPEHWSQLGIHRDRMPLAPNYVAYDNLDRQGELLCMTLRKNGRLAGYYIAQVSPGLHYVTTLQGKMDMMWVEPSLRHAGAGVRLFLAVENELKRRGVKIWFSGSKMCSPLHESMDRLLTHMGFAPVDLYYAKWIGNNASGAPLSL